MVFEHIEKLKDEYTDRFVMVDESRPELQRFSGLVGRVKTVNMSGRALVEFDEWVNNIGWFDIDLDFLKVVDGPAAAAPKETAKSAPKAAAAKEPSALEKTRASAGKKTAAAMDTDDILAAARGTAAPAKKESAEKPEKAKVAPGGAGMSMEEILAAARGGAGAAAPKEKSPAKRAEKAPAQTPPPAAGKSPQEMSVAEMLAAARSSDSKGGAAAAEAPSPTKPAEAKTPGKEPALPKQPAPKPAAGGVDTSGMTVEQMLALARDQATGKSPPPQAAKEAPQPKAPQNAPAESPAEEAPAAQAPEEETPKEEQPAEAPAEEKAEAATGELPKDIAGMVEYCRRVDGK